MPVFHEVPAPSIEALRAVVAQIITRLMRLLTGGFQRQPHEFAAALYAWRNTTVCLNDWIEQQAD